MFVNQNITTFIILVIHCSRKYNCTGFFKYKNLPKRKFQIISWGLKKPYIVPGRLFVVPIVIAGYLHRLNLRRGEWGDWLTFFSLSSHSSIFQRI
jgi:hypothetical protein